MFALYRRFEWTGFMQRAVRAWVEGDRYIIELDEAGTALQREIESSSPSTQRIAAILTSVSAINENLTPIENQFVDALSDLSRTAYKVLQAIMLAASPSRLILGTILSLRILQQRKRADEHVRHLA